MLLKTTNNIDESNFIKFYWLLSMHKYHANIQNIQKKY